MDFLKFGTWGHDIYEMRTVMRHKSAHEQSHVFLPAHGSDAAGYQAVASQELAKVNTMFITMEATIP